jgi:hypothetical protein
VTFEESVEQTGEPMNKNRIAKALASVKLAFLSEHHIHQGREA